MSRFVSAGTDEVPTERDEAWAKAQQQIEATKQQKATSSGQQDGKSLYETLQANKGDFTWHFAAQTYTADDLGVR